MKEEIKQKQITLSISKEEIIRYLLYIYPSEATDPRNMIKKAKQKIEELDLDNELGDRIFCLIDLDLSQDQMNKIEEEKKSKNRKKCHVEFILSNPCFEVWLLYYFVEYPKFVNSSQKVKAQLKKICAKL